MQHMRFLDRLLRRERSHDSTGMTTMTTMTHDDDPDRQTECHCGEPAEVWVDFLWRDLSGKREFLFGHTIEDLCGRHMIATQKSTNTEIITWGEL